MPFASHRIAQALVATSEIIPPPHSKIEIRGVLHFMNRIPMKHLYPC